MHIIKSIINPFRNTRKGHREAFDMTSPEGDYHGSDAANQAVVSFNYLSPYWNDTRCIWLEETTVEVGPLPDGGTSPAEYPESTKDFLDDSEPSSTVPRRQDPDFGGPNGYSIYNVMFKSNIPITYVSFNIEGGTILNLSRSDATLNFGASQWWPGWVSNLSFRRNQYQGWYRAPNNDEQGGSSTLPGFNFNVQTGKVTLKWDPIIQQGCQYSQVALETNCADFDFVSMCAASGYSSGNKAPIGCPLRPTHVQNGSSNVTDSEGEYLPSYAQEIPPYSIAQLVIKNEAEEGWVPPKITNIHTYTNPLYITNSAVDNTWWGGAGTAFANFIYPQQMTYSYYASTDPDTSPYGTGGPSVSGNNGPEFTSCPTLYPTPLAPSIIVDEEITQPTNFDTHEYVAPVTSGTWNDSPGVTQISLNLKNAKGSESIVPNSFNNVYDYTRIQWPEELCETDSGWTGHSACTHARRGV